MSANLYNLDDSDDVYSSARPRKIGKTKILTTRRTLNANMHDTLRVQVTYWRWSPNSLLYHLLPKLPYLAFKTSLLHFTMASHR